MDSDRALFTKIVLPHLRQSYQLARWLTGNAVDAEDVVQEASLRAFRSIRDCSGANPRGWVLAIVRNTANTWLSRNRSPGAATKPLHPDVPESDVEAQEDVEADTPETALLRKATVEEVRRAVDALPAVFREVIVLREIQELDYREIAEIAGIPIGTVMSRLSRARSMLFKTLEDIR